MSTSNSTGSEGLNVYSGLGLKTDAFVNVAFLSIAFWTLIEVVYLNFTTFKEWKSLFFLTMTVSTVSQILLNTGTIITLASPNAILAAAISMPGLVLSVPAQFGLLYLRLRLLSPNFRILRVLLIMAVFEQIFIEIPYDVLWLGSIINGSVVWTNTFTIWSQAECIIWSFVDMSFAAAYIMQVRALWSPTADSDRKLVLKQISFMVGAIVVLDTAYIVSTYAAPEEIFYSLMVRLMMRVFDELFTLLQHIANR